MRKKQALPIICVALTLAICAGIFVIIWHKTKKGDENSAKHELVKQINLTDTVTVYVKQDSIALNFQRSDSTDQKPIKWISDSNFYLANGSNNVTELTISDRWQKEGTVQFNWMDGSSLILENGPVSKAEYFQMACLSVRWDIPNGTLETPLDCVDLKEALWYGGFEDAFQYWPLNENNITAQPFITNDAFKPTKVGDIIERLLVSSSGLGIYIHENSTSYISISSEHPKQLCFHGKIGNDTPYINVKFWPELSYDICQAPNIAQLWKGMANKYIRKPDGIPSENVLRYPIWSTWAIFRSNVNQSQVLEFAEKIKENGFGISQLEIDDQWASSYGDFDFDDNKFPNATKMISILSDNKIPVTVWLHPFFNKNSKSFKELADAGYLVKSNMNNSEPALTAWWRGNDTGLLDVTNKGAVSWYLNKTNYLRQQYNITSFKFDGGESIYLPQKYELHQKISDPSYFSTFYAIMASEADESKRQEVRTGFRSQHLPIFVRMMDRQSSWDHELGLKSFIPTALTMGLMGYNFILPDMVGGNAYDVDNIDKIVKPDPEIFVRWLQATALMPAIQFSIAPWMYNDTIIKISKKFTDLHENFADKIIALAKNCVERSEPIIRPLWWLAPNDVEALLVESQFLLGDDVLVAPVLDKGAISRDIYLPKGLWRYDSTRTYKVYRGPLLLQNFPAPLDVLPYFTKIHFSNRPMS